MDKPIVLGIEHVVILISLCSKCKIMIANIIHTCDYARQKILKSSHQSWTQSEEKRKYDKSGV